MAYKTPGVYIKEISKFPPSVAQVETAIPAFIGYTEKAVDVEGNDLTKVPTRIKSLVDFELLFGGDYVPAAYTVTLDADDLVTSIAVKKFYLYNSMRSFFDNGGGDCYIVSVGSYTDDIEYEDTTDPLNPLGLKPGLDALLKYDEPTLILFPDAVGKDADGTNALSDVQLGTLQANTLSQCAKLQDRFGVFDVLDGFQEGATPIENFRNRIGTNNLKYGATYYPWIHTIYEHEFLLRDVLVEAGTPDTPILDYVLPPDADLDPLKDTLVTESGRTDTVVATLSGLTVANFQSLTDYVQGLIDQIKAMPSSNGAGIAANFVSMLQLLRSVALSFDTLDDAAGLGNDIDNQIEDLKTDSDLHDQIIALIAIEKNASVLSELSDLADEGAVETAYVALDTANEWMDGTTDTFTAVADIPAVAPADLDVTALANNKAKALAIISYIQENVDLDKFLNALASVFDIAMHNEMLAEQQLIEQYPFFRNVALSIQKEMSLLPPSGTIVGVYSAVDNARGVWKAPANVSLNSVLMPAIKVSTSDQESLNVHPTGKSINVIRAFTGKGILVWGARTLAGNDNEWRYVSVRRFFNMVEESVKKASEPFVFEPNDANTWVKVRSMISNYLTVLWRQGALAGASTTDAFFVNIGLGETMTAQDILEGRMNVEIGMAVVRPAEFIILKFSHKMQLS